MCSSPFLGCTAISGGYPTNICFNSAENSSNFTYFCLSSESSSSSGSAEYNYAYKNASHEKCAKQSIYKVRPTSSSSSDGVNKVSISVVSDSSNLGKICVKAEKQTAYAVPALCNVDIVLAVPVNAASCSINNDGANPCAHSSASEIPENVMKTPIYQMGQACKRFVKNNFYHTRGVYMSLIPYSGKLSLPPNRANAGWTCLFAPFYNDRQSQVIAAGLYATSGIYNASLAQNTYSWGGDLRGYPIMFRRGSQIRDSRFGSNNYYYYRGSLFQTAVPTRNDEYRYLCMNLNPCTIEALNPGSMSCEASCTHFLPNPYYVIEPTADLVKIYEMCNALYPIGDPHNTSNFIFIAFEWANNMFQSWTTDPQKSVYSGNADNKNATLGSQSKTASGRKKAVIILVNKPDYFAPDELTYVGFQNDRKVATITTDPLSFSNNYNNNTGDKTLSSPMGCFKFNSDGDKVAWNNNVQGYAYITTEGDMATCTLKVSNQVTTPVKITAEPCTEVNIRTYDSDLYKIRPGGWFSVGSVGVGPVQNGGSPMLVVSNADGTVAYSSNGQNWTKLCDGQYPKAVLSALSPALVKDGFTFDKVFKDESGNTLFYYASANKVVTFPSDQNSDFYYTEEEVSSFVGPDGTTYNNVKKVLRDKKSGDVAAYLTGDDRWYTFGLCDYGSDYKFSENWSGTINGVQYNNIKCIHSGDYVYAYYAGGNWTDCSYSRGTLTQSLFSGVLYDANTRVTNVNCLRDSDNKIIYFWIGTTAYCPVNVWYRNYSDYHTDPEYINYNELCFFKMSNGEWSGNIKPITNSNSNEYFTFDSDCRLKFRFSEYSSLKDTDHAIGTWDGTNYIYLFPRSLQYISGMCYDNGVWIRLRNNDPSNPLETSSDYCRTWNKVGGNSALHLPSYNAVGFGNGVFMVIGNDGYAYTSADGKTWSKGGYVCDDAVRCVHGLAYGKNKWVAAIYRGTTYQSTDNGRSWQFMDSTLAALHGCENNYMAYGYCGGFTSAYCASKAAHSADGANWSRASSSTVNARNITYYKGKLYCIDPEGDHTYISEVESDKQFRFKFTNLTSSTAETQNNNEYRLDKQTSFIITPEQISSNVDSDGYREIKFEICNIKLICVEMTEPIKVISADKGNVVLMNASNNIEDSTEAAKMVTKTLGANLKKSGIKVYMVKYRIREGKVGNQGSNETEDTGSEAGNAEKESGGNTETGRDSSGNTDSGTTSVNGTESISEDSEDFSYLDECADFIREASNEKELQEVLNDIAKDIKDWAGYTAAKLVN